MPGSELSARWAKCRCARKFIILVILQVACALASLLGPSVGLALPGPLQAAFKSAPGRFVVLPGHLVD
ncbi:hypothetical protein CD006_00380 [Enterobacter sp. 10-1]|nr:hypothetical protein CD006_00380 [Enterobacter sp. 10-1]